jgi:hypothetical protein
MTTQKKPSPVSTESPRCIVAADPGQLCFAVDFTLADGRVHGFPYAHLLSYLYEKNPDAALHPDAPPDRFSLWFSTHDVVIFGWRLSALAPLLQQGRLASIVAVETRYYGLSNSEPFVSDIRVTAAQKE